MILFLQVSSSFIQHLYYELVPADLSLFLQISSFTLHMYYDVVLPTGIIMYITLVLPYCGVAMGIILYITIILKSLAEFSKPKTQCS